MIQKKNNHIKYFENIKKLILRNEDVKFINKIVDDYLI